jgi:aminoglycoside phosphotransferase (APT) family kinase protein
MPGQDVGPALVEFLRELLGVRELGLAEPVTRLSGGFDTSIYAIRLRDAPALFAAPLVLRIMAPHGDPGPRVLRERAIQNAVASQGYPAPQVLAATTDPVPLGAPFLLMERLPGRVLVDAQRVGMAGVLVDAQLRLHALKAGPLFAALDQEPGSGGHATVELEGYLRSLEYRAGRAKLDGLKPVLSWLRSHRPSPGPLVICHGDFHPRNLLVAAGRLTGVVDWPNTIVADAEFDVASTLNILRFVPADLAAPSKATRVLAAVARPILVARYLRGYRRRRRRRLDPDRLAYYEVATAMRALVQTGEARVGRGRALGALERSDYATRLAARAQQLTGVAVALPIASPEP